jgi:hypothetical protein
MIDEKQIQQWLADEGLFKQRIHDDNANFHFLVNFPENNNIDVVQPKGKEDLIIIGCGTSIGPEHIELIKAAPNSKKQQIIWDFKFTINSFLLDFQLDHPDDILQIFIISDQIFEDGLSKNSLIGTIKKVFKVKVQCLMCLEKLFGVVADGSENSHDENSMFV